MRGATVRVVRKRWPDAALCADPFHVVSWWATDALDEVRRQVWNEARGAVLQRRAPGATGTAKMLKGIRYTLWKNPENLTENQQTKLSWVAKPHPRLHRAYLLKEDLRVAFQLKVQAGKDAIDRSVGLVGTPLSHPLLRPAATSDRQVDTGQHLGHDRVGATTVCERVPRPRSVRRCPRPAPEPPTSRQRVRPGVDVGSSSYRRPPPSRGGLAQEGMQNDSAWRAVHATKPSATGNER